MPHSEVRSLKPQWSCLCCSNSVNSLCNSDTNSRMCFAVGPSQYSAASSRQRASFSWIAAFSRSIKVRCAETILVQWTSGRRDTKCAEHDLARNIDLCRPSLVEAGAIESGRHGAVGNCTELTALRSLSKCNADSVFFPPNNPARPVHIIGGYDQVEFGRIADRAFNGRAAPVSDRLRTVQSIARCRREVGRN